MSRALNIRKLLLVLGDLFLFYLALFLTILFGFWDKLDVRVFQEHLVPFSMLYISWLVVLYAFGLYDLHLLRGNINLYPRIFGAILICFIAGAIFFYLLPLASVTPKTNLAINISLFAVFLLIWRKIFYRLFSSYFLNKVAVIGGDKERNLLSQEIKNRPYLGYKIVDIPNTEDLLSKAKQGKINTLIVSDDLRSDPKIVQALYQCLPARINFLNLSRAYEIICQKIPIYTIDTGWFLENLREGEKGLYDKLKRGLDIILAILILLISFPLIPLIALFIKAGDGSSVIYKQERIGKDGKAFLLYKFRSMIAEAEKMGAVWAEKEDPRVTNIGRFIRKTHLDELPQMINVIKGDISLVGPRPERPEFVLGLEKQIPHYHLRHLIRPGFTGWAQIKFRYGRSIIDSQEKFHYDLYYLKNRSFFLDLGILLRTFQLFFKRE
ncbi:MAG: exopolysaccharide biosynthesis polyprenyl glycosylphosphotransferase [Candidatus Nealsonbacteria bacterium]|nr:exopolysaccharide biosynthesis polyprenyl glycosylphosphotransferase [Candidatus Nealsonbacteria bacterium]